MTELTTDPELPSAGPAKRRRRTAMWIAVAVAVPLLAIVAVLATTDSAAVRDATRAAESSLLGQPAPETAGRTIDGDTFHLADRRGEWVLVNFFATWCVPCREEHDDLIRWQERHADDGDASVVGVVFSDNLDAVRRFRRDEGGDWPMLTDDGGRIAVDYGVIRVPESYLITPDGIVATKIVGGILEGELESLLQRAKARYEGRG